METESLIAQYEQAYDELLPPPIAERAKRNLRAAVADSSRTTYPRDPLHESRGCVDTGFCWARTPEQDGFWYSVSCAVRRGGGFPSVKTLR